MRRELKFIILGIIFIIFFAFIFHNIYQKKLFLYNEKILKEVKLAKEKEIRDRAQRIENLNSIKPIYQNVTEYQMYHCNKEGMLQGSYAKKACKMVNFIMVNNAYNDIKVDIGDLKKMGYDCDFDYKKAQLDFNYQQLLELRFNGKFITDLNHQYPDVEKIISNKKEYFTLKDAIDDGLPVMLWMVPKKDKTLKNGHLITVYKYKEQDGKLTYYFYDTFNKDLSRNLNEFMSRWKIAELFIFKK